MTELAAASVRTIAHRIPVSLEMVVDARAVTIALDRVLEDAWWRAMFGRGRLTVVGPMWTSWSWLDVVDDLLVFAGRAVRAVRRARGELRARRRVAWSVLRHGAHDSEGDW